ncbi:unnamed protein product [Dovyalis caffra]|uniref:Flavin-containing monooxygenase n=1 Tax=Dovyalis caffra TaxID=77055 RepID=A0AAV1R5T9_9ROSI|nr:unnamed protein product [Dovyalis caffra]
MAIVGAGISRLFACKYALSNGFNRIVFEARSSIGGVWSMDKYHRDYKAPNPKPAFQFSDFAWPDSFNSKVSGINYEGSSDEEIQSWSQWSGNDLPPCVTTLKVYQVDFVILCLGWFTDVLNIPEFPPPNKGPEQFMIADALPHLQWASIFKADANLITSSQSRCKLDYF